MNSKLRQSDTRRVDSASTQLIKAKVHQRLLESMDLAEAQRMPIEQLHRQCSRKVDALLNEQRCPLSAPEKQQLLRGADLLLCPALVENTGDALRQTV